MGSTRTSHSVALAVVTGLAIGTSLAADFYLECKWRLRRQQDTSLYWMADLKHPRCQGKECTERPYFGREGDARPTFCTAHRLDSMVHLKSPRCRDEECTEYPSFGHEARGTRSGLVSRQTQRATRVRGRRRSAATGRKACHCPPGPAVHVPGDPGRTVLQLLRRALFVALKVAASTSRRMQQ